jgi:DNA repair protein RadC
VPPASAEAPLSGGRAVGVTADRPRERLFNLGPQVLATNELLAVLLGTGTRRLPALELANQILADSGGLKGLAEASASALSRLPGLKSARAARVVAALELGRRAVAEPDSPRPAFKTPSDVGRFLQPRLSGKPVEEFGLLILDTRNRLKRLQVISRGSLNGSLVHPREVFREAIALQAAALVLCHNHPSGDPTPSREDLELTRRLREAGLILGIEVLDHVIVGQGGYVSFKEEGLL